MGMWVITGASRGIGLQISLTALERGHDVLGTVRKAADAKRIERFGIEAALLDVNEPASVNKLRRRLNGMAVDVLVNNAAVGGGTSELLRLNCANLWRFMQTNVCGPLSVTRALLQNLRRGNRHLVVNMTTRMASLCEAGLDEHAISYEYRISKVALNMATRCVAREFPDLTFLLLHPGWVKTRMGGPRAPIEPAAAAAAIYDCILRSRRPGSAAFIEALTRRPISW